VNAPLARAVVIGGGTGAPVSIRTLLGLGFAVDAVVAMADDGGSTGLLREKAGAVPPGDIRKCLVAMAASQDDPLVRAFRYRFDYAQNHALGNLVLTALASTGCTFPQAIAVCEGILQARGHVYPSTLDDITLYGRTRDGRDIRGQSAISHSDCALSRAFLGEGTVNPYEPALEAIRSADLIVLGPGSLFTSIIPNLLVPGVIEAVEGSHAVTVFVCSTADMQGETHGLNCAEHVEMLMDHGMRNRLDYVLIHDTHLPHAVLPHPVPAHSGQMSRDPSGPLHPVAASATVAEADRLSPMVDKDPTGDGMVHPILVTDQLLERIESEGPRVIARNFVDPYRPTWHEPAYLAEALEEVCRLCRLPLK